MATNEDYEKLRKKYPSKINRARSIKLYCKEQCCCSDMESWKSCGITNCFLWRYRFGKEIHANATSFNKITGKTVHLLKKKPIIETDTSLNTTSDNQHI